VLKTTIHSLLALALVAALPGCSKQQPAQPATGPATTTAPTAPVAGTEGAKGSVPHPLPSAKPGANVDLTGIAKAEGGLTVAEVFAQKDQLAGKKVIVRGKVVKANSGIMGKNWLHVRDGSGADQAADLTVTTAGPTPKVGDTVLVSGPVSLNKDFGMGYRYEAIVEDAEVKIEATSP
jgi:hypothetical protein